MITVIKKGKPISELIKKLDQLVSKRNRGLQSSKYSGAIKSEIDPLGYQSRLRNEWE